MLKRLSDTGRKIDGAEAAPLGIVRALSERDFMDRMRKAAVELAASSSPRSTAIIKHQVYDALSKAWAKHLSSPKPRKSDP